MERHLQIAALEHARRQEPRYREMGMPEDDATVHGLLDGLLYVASLQLRVLKQTLNEVELYAQKMQRDRDGTVRQCGIDLAVILNGDL